MRYAEFTVPLIKAVQEQQQMIGEKDKQMDAMQKQLDKQQQELDQLKSIIKNNSPNAIPETTNTESVPSMEQW